MDINTISQILLAAVIAHGIHGFVEPIGINKKVKRLQAYISKQKVKESPMNINTRLKSYGIGFAAVGIVFLIAYFVISILEIETDTALWASLVIIGLLEIFSTITIDKYHVEIEKVTKEFQK